MLYSGNKSMFRFLIVYITCTFSPELKNIGKYIQNIKR